MKVPQVLMDSLDTLDLLVRKGHPAYLDGQLPRVREASKVHLEMTRKTKYARDADLLEQLDFRDHKAQQAHRAYPATEAAAPERKDHLDPRVLQGSPDHMVLVVREESLVTQEEILNIANVRERTRLAKFKMLSFLSLIFSLCLIY